MAPRSALVRWGIVTSVAALLALAISGDARAQRTTFGKFIKAARALNEWRFDEARKLINELAASKPKAKETRYLRAEMSFIDGNYPQALKRLKGMKNRDVSGNVGQLRKLATSTYSVTKGFVRKESAKKHFVIYYKPGKDDVLADLASEVLESAYARLGKDFGFHPTEKVRVEILSRPSDLAKLSTLTEREIETTGTIALCKYGKLMLVSPRATIFGYPWMDTLTHEYVHYVVARMSRDRVPVWLHEGLARYQETRWRAPPSKKLSAIDSHRLARAVTANKLISFKAMHPSMAKLPSQAAAALAFAEVHSMIMYLHGKVGYEGIRNAIKLIRGGKSAMRAVGEVMKTKWPTVERNWKGFLRTQKLSASRALAGRVHSRRIRFRKGGKKDENVGLDEVRSAAAKKYARLGGLLRSRGMAAAAAIEYEKALLFTPGNPFISSKLSHTYLQLQRYAAAIKLAKPLLGIDENDAAPPTVLGIAYLATGDHKQAKTAFEHALRVSPFDPRVRCGLAQAYSNLADTRVKRERSACRKLRGR